MKIFKKEKPFSYLWAILIAVILDIVLLIAALVLDNLMLPAADTAVRGHAVPAFLILALPVIAMIFGGAVLFSLVMVVVRMKQNKK